MKAIALRLTPGSDLKQELWRIVEEHGLRAGYIVSCVGSLVRTRLRMAGAAGEPECFTSLDEPAEIVSLIGTLCADGLHLHMAVAGQDGRCVGGRVVEGCVVHTTAELIVGELRDVEFRREYDPETGYRELRVADHS